MGLDQLCIKKVPAKSEIAGTFFRGQVSQEPRHPTKQGSREPRHPTKQVNRGPRHPTKQATRGPRCSTKCPQPRPSPYLSSMEQREFFLLIWLCLYTQHCVTGRFNGAFQFLLIQRFLGNDFRGSFAVGRGHFPHLKSFSDRIIHMCLAHARMPCRLHLKSSLP